MTVPCSRPTVVGTYRWHRRSLAPLVGAATGRARRTPRSRSGWSARATGRRTRSSRGQRRERLLEIAVGPRGPRRRHRRQPQRPGRHRGAAAPGHPPRPLHPHPAHRRPLGDRLAGAWSSTAARTGSATRWTPGATSGRSRSDPTRRYSGRVTTARRARWSLDTRQQRWLNRPGDDERAPGPAAPQGRAVGHRRGRPGGHRGGARATPTSSWSGAGCTRPTRHGKDVGELVGTRPDRRRRDRPDVDDILALDADCVVYSPLMPNDDEVAAHPASGKNVVTPLGWFYPDPATIGRARRRLRARAASTLHGTGIHPGGITERFPLMVSALSRAGHPRAGRGVLRHPHLRRAGRDPPHDAVRRARPRRRGRASWPTLLGAGFRQSVRMVADELGFDLDPELRDDPRDRGGHRPDRLADRGDRAGPRRRPAVPVGGARRRRAGGDRGGRTGSWARSTSTRVELRPGGRALRGRGHRRPDRASSPSRGSTPNRSRRASSATPASSPPPCTASTPSRTSSRPSRASDLPRPAAHRRPRGAAGRTRPA